MCCSYRQVFSFYQSSMLPPPAAQATGRIIDSARNKVIDSEHMRNDFGVYFYKQHVYYARL